jgi:hypothetical protein
MRHLTINAITALAATAEQQAKASGLQLWGAFMFGAFLGWFTYFVNRHRRGAVKLTDLGTVIAAVGAGAVLALFPAGTDMFGAYGIGLAAGFFAQFVVLVIIVLTTKNWNMGYFLDGRTPVLETGQQAGDGRPPLGDQDGRLAKALDE